MSAGNNWVMGEPEGVGHVGLYIVFFYMIRDVMILCYLT